MAGVDRHRRFERTGLAGDALAIEDVAGTVDDQHVVGAVAIDVGHDGVGRGRGVGQSRGGECAVAVAHQDLEGILIRGGDADCHLPRDREVQSPVVAEIALRDHLG